MTTVVRDRHTVAEYLSWPDDVRCELIGGTVHDKSPAPSLEHQSIVIALGSLLFDHLRRSAEEGGGGEAASLCRVFVAPVDVVLSRDTVVQPDVVVVCDAAKLAGGRHVDGAPEVVIEVLSPATALKDRREKRALYEAHGVAEYLLVAPEEHTIEVFRRGTDGRYAAPDVLGPGDRLTLATLPGLEISLSEALGWADLTGGSGPAQNR